METKICSFCHNEKDINNFQQVKQRGKTVRRAHCNICESERKKAYYRMNREKYLEKSKVQRESDPVAYKEYQHRYRQENLDELREKARKRGTSEKGRELNRIRSQRYRDTAEGKMKDSARSMVHFALLAGKIEKPEQCTQCGEKVPLEAHHEDYSKPLEVLWFCKLCHEKLHHLNEGQ
ncbi:hypothetical protein [Peribacillus frigoritolerans]|uniref:Uncharacterized protein n=1 Tax=Peribacillus castrilensis TaxID=2897690 RepID=A0AAW9NQC4_9BACI|nr:hypothetical protein [Peribacillus castrilensis]